MLKKMGWLLLSGAFFSVPVHAEDIDLYTGVNPELSSSIDKPTVLFVWDTAANGNASADVVCNYATAGGGQPSLGKTALGMEQCAMVNALQAIKSNPLLLGQVNIGLMIYNKNSFGAGNGNCGYLKFAPRLMDATGIDALTLSLKNMASSDIANQSAVGDTIAESWFMLNGAQSTCSGVNYSGVIDSSNQCKKPLVVFIGNAFTNSSPVDGNINAKTLIQNELTGSFPYTATSSQYKSFTTPIAVPGINTSGNVNNSYWADEWAGFMNSVMASDSTTTPQRRNISTFTISVTDLSNLNQTQPVINYYGEMARQGGGKTFVVSLNDSDGLVQALMDILNDVQATDSVFASATLPVAANTQGTYLNQVYIAMFRPATGARPRWYGNLKQYHFGLDASGRLVLADSTQNPDAGTVVSATNSQTGALSTGAISFWTTNTPETSGWPTQGFWVNSRDGEGLAFDSPDGDLVEKGGAGQMARAVNAVATYANASNDNERKILTCNGAGACSLGFAEFSVANSYLMSSSDTVLGVTNSATGVTGTLTAGIPFTSGASTGACTGNGNNPCEITMPFGTADHPSLQPLDVVINELDSTKVPCPVSTGCSVQRIDTGVTPNTFTIRADSASNGHGVDTGTVFYKADKLVTVNAPGHPFSKGDTVALSNCSGRASAYGFSALPSGTTPKEQVVVTSVDADRFTFAYKSAAVTVPSSAVQCTITSSLTASNLINWVRGWDVAANEEKAGPCALKEGVPVSADCAVTIRPSLHGDVLHSRPAVVDYAGDIVVYYGSNDGHFRAINGNKTASVTGDGRTVRAGGEIWSFVAPEFHGKFKRLFKNDPRVDLVGITDPDKEPKDYFFDGSTTVLRDSRNITSPTSTNVPTYIYLTARRGGRFIYALNVTNKFSPQYMWKVSTNSIPELGQTWSQPKVALLRGWANPVLIMGAGYAPEQDEDPVVATTDSTGRGVIVLDAITGEVVWAALPSCSGVNLASGGTCVSNSALTRSIAADVTILDRNSDGYIDRVYAADTGANIWRVDFEPRGYGLTSSTVDGVTTSINGPSDWQITKFASLGGSGNDARKFLFAPDVVPTRDFDAVMAVSGDREHPLYTSESTAGLAYNVQNRIYMLKDPHVGANMPGTFTPLTDNDLEANPDSTTFNASQDGVDGFYIDLGSSGDEKGEKGVNAPITVAGKTYFATNYPDQPDGRSCTAGLGIARAYTLDFMTGGVTFATFVGGGLPPSPVAGLVQIGDDTLPFVIGAAGPSPFDPVKPPIDLSNNRKRAYWYVK